MTLFLILNDDKRLNELEEFKAFLATFGAQQPVLDGSVIVSQAVNYITPTALNTAIQEIRDKLIGIANTAGLTEAKIFIAHITGTATWNNISNFRTQKMVEALTKELVVNPTSGS